MSSTERNKRNVWILKLFSIVWLNWELLDLFYYCFIFLSYLHIYATKHFIRFFMCAYSDLSKTKIFSRFENDLLSLYAITSKFLRSCSDLFRFINEIFQLRVCAQCRNEMCLHLSPTIRILSYQFERIITGNVLNTRYDYSHFWISMRAHSCCDQQHKHFSD